MLQTCSGRQPGQENEETPGAGLASATVLWPLRPCCWGVEVGQGPAPSWHRWVLRLSPVKRWGRTCHGTRGVAVTPDLPWAPGLAARPPATALHPTALCIHRSLSLTLPQASVYPIISLIRCLSVKATSVSSCRAQLSPLYLSIQLTSPLPLIPQGPWQTICSLLLYSHSLCFANGFHTSLQFFLHK